MTYFIGSLGYGCCGKKTPVDALKKHPTALKVAFVFDLLLAAGAIGLGVYAYMHGGLTIPKIGTITPEMAKWLMGGGTLALITNGFTGMIWLNRILKHNNRGHKSLQPPPTPCGHDATIRQLETDLAASRAREEAPQRVYEQAAARVEEVAGPLRAANAEALAHVAELEGRLEAAQTYREAIEAGALDTADLLEDLQAELARAEGTLAANRNEMDGAAMEAEIRSQTTALEGRVRELEVEVAEAQAAEAAALANAEQLEAMISRVMAEITGTSEQLGQMHRLIETYNAVEREIDALIEFLTKAVPAPTERTDMLVEDPLETALSTLMSLKEQIRAQADGLPQREESLNLAAAETANLERLVDEAYSSDPEAAETDALIEELLQTRDALRVAHDVIAASDGEVNNSLDDMAALLTTLTNSHIVQDDDELTHLRRQNAAMRKEMLDLASQLHELRRQNGYGYGYGYGSA